MRPRDIIAAGLAAAVRLARNTKRAVRYASRGPRPYRVSRDASPLPDIDSVRRLAPMALVAMPIPPDEDPTPTAPIAIAVPGRPEPQIVRDASPLPTLTAEQHAETFLDWLQSEGGLTGDDILVCDLEEMHREMCLDLGVALMRWALVSKHLRAILGERKRYVWHRETPDSDKVRLCVMSVPSRASGADKHPRCPARVPWPELPHAAAA